MNSKKAPKAAALRYDPQREDAPRVTASGKGLMADKILEVAAGNDIPIIEDPNLAEVLAALDLNVQIPPDLYQAVAEILVFLYRVNGAADR